LAGGVMPASTPRASSARVQGATAMANVKIRPLGDKVLVKRDEPTSRTESGIYLPETAKDKPKQGKIVAVGNGNLNKETGEYMPFTVKKGDSVIFSSYSGTEVKIGTEDYLIMTEDDILGVIE
jgi:chaperonin GroES